MPRSGSTLVEQILSQHSQVRSYGEIGALTKALEQYSVLNTPYAAVSNDQLVEKKPRLESVVQNYYKYLGLALDDSHSVITEKTLINYVHVGLITQLFPNATILHCTRNPLDTCLSIYFQNFGTSQPYAGNLENIAFFDKVSL